MEELAGILIVMSIMSATVLSLYFYYRARNKERMAMIDKGIYKFEQSKKTPIRGLKYGLFFSGIGIGIFFGYILDTYTNVPDEPAYFSMILLFGGLSFILGYFIELKKDKAGK